VGSGFKFLENVEVEEREEELDEKVGEGRKQKRTGDEEGLEKKKRLGGLPRLVRRSKALGSDNWWKRKVVSCKKGEEWKQERIESVERTLTPENFESGREPRGLEMNNSRSLRNNFDTNREALFPGGGGGWNEE
jgi:hypothetical protein